MSLTKPTYLKIGDKIAIVATARKTSKEEVAAAISLFESWGLEVVLGDNLFKEDNQFAGTDTDRLSDFQNALNNTDVKAIIVARGGYGTIRIIDEIDFSTFTKKPKWIIGYSDITILHCHIHPMGIETLHATMPINIDLQEESKKDAIETLRKALFGETLSYIAETHPLNKKGNCKGEIVGGNLSILYSLLGSTSQIDTNGKILFLEDLDEYLYHVDRMMFSLKRAGMLKGLAGLIVGGMTDMRDNKTPFGKTAEEIISEAVSEYNYPVCFNFPAGHINNNQAIIMGRVVNLSVEEIISITYS